MKKLWHEYLYHIGLRKKGAEPTDKDAEEEPEEEGVQEYARTKDKELAIRFLDYLKTMDDFQKTRQSTIEGKNSQLVGQASIVTSIFSLFIPLLIDKFNAVNLWVTVPLALLFLMATIYYLGLARNIKPVPFLYLAHFLVVRFAIPWKQSEPILSC